MKIIVPMAGRGTRLRPHTLTTPKPLLKIAGKPIVQRLLEDLVVMSNNKVKEINFIVGDFGKNTEEQLKKIASDLEAKSRISYQKQPQGTAHAVLCAKKSLKGNIIVAFADTLFRANFKINYDQDGMIWTKQVEDPSKFGVVKTDENKIITDFIEKPKNLVSDQAIIGIYFFKEGLELAYELQKLIDNNKMASNGEYQFTDALENMKGKDTKFITGIVDEWFDYGNKDATIKSSTRYMDILNGQPLIDSSAYISNSILLDPIYVGENARIIDSVIGPHTSIGKNTNILGSIIKNSIIQDNSVIRHVNCHNSMIGNKVYYEGRAKDLSIGDFNVIKE